MHAQVNEETVAAGGGKMLSKRQAAYLRDARSAEAHEICNEVIERAIRRHVATTVDRNELLEVVQQCAWAARSHQERTRLLDVRVAGYMATIGAFTSAANSEMVVARMKVHRQVSIIQALTRARQSQRLVRRRHLVASLGDRTNPTLVRLVSLLLDLHDSGSALYPTVGESAGAKRLKQLLEAEERTESRRAAQDSMHHEYMEKAGATPQLGDRSDLLRPVSAASERPGGKPTLSYVQRVRGFEISPLLNPVRNSTQRRGPPEKSVVTSPLTRPASSKRKKRPDSAIYQPGGNTGTDRSAELRGLQSLLMFSREQRLTRNKQQRDRQRSQYHRLEGMEDPMSVTPDDLVQRSVQLVGSAQDHGYTELTVSTIPRSSAASRPASANTSVVKDGHGPLLQNSTFNVATKQERPQELGEAMEELLTCSKGFRLAKDIATRAAEGSGYAISPTTRSLRRK